MIVFRRIGRARGMVKEGFEAFAAAMRAILDGDFDRAQRRLFFLGWTPSDRK